MIGKALTSDLEHAGSIPVIVLWHGNPSH